MKRGLVVLDHDEIPESEWTSRVGTLQNRLAEDGIDIALVYGDVYRSDDIGYLTNLCIYWNEGVVAVPAEGEPSFLTKLSPRVHTWMRRTSKVSDLHSGRAFGPLVAGLLDGRERGVAGLVDAALWPAALVTELTGALPGWELRPLGGLVREQRLRPSPNETALIRDATALLDEALRRAVAPGLAPADRVSVVERTLRGGGYTEVLVDTTSAQDGAVSVDVTGQYRHNWLRAARTVADPGGASPAAGLEAGLEAAIGAVAAGTAESALGHAALSALPAFPDGTEAEVRWIDQADLSTGGDYRPPGEDVRLEQGSVGAVAIELILPGGGRAVVADTVLVGPRSAERLTGSKEPRS
ncbi:hypothetical protein Acsp03_39950 [Actinomadura sp. NBRC 104412]|uniref:aminopeptidase P family N-terminal domain-containing protein n=1 Tax=Actinomadura sp. NBRC 104412 TaxID=3032203 RepID=UPI0024A14E83|nr:aminopeptidase P family N-terminal domain-containing protein [Actinomadura sp. NBRC 104412]GLZ06529.1 hypothetical protein Acsp03_39950 [Actinomadura sp. NBRC 104412]